jgi:hypothetical protein
MVYDEVFDPVEFYYQEISKLLLNHSPESLEDVGE